MKVTKLNGLFMVQIYFYISVLTLIFFIFRFGLYLPDRKKTHEIIRKRLREFDNGRYSFYIDKTSDEVLYNQVIVTIFIASLLWFVELVSFFLRKVKKFL